MKLTITPPVTPCGSSRVSGQPKSQGEGGFNRVLAETMEGQSTSPEERMHSADSLSTIIGVGPDWIGRETIEFDLERLIDRLDVYREKLSNTSCTLKDIEPDLQAVNAQKQRLADRMEELPVDHPMKELLNEGLIVASAEIERFYRGEYC